MSKLNFENISDKQLILNDILITRCWLEDFVVFGIRCKDFDKNMVNLLSELIHLYILIKDD